MIVEIVNYTKTKVSQHQISKWVDGIQKELLKQPTRFKKSKKKSTLTIVLVPEKRSQRLNFMFRKKNHATDVLSFSGTYPGHLGDLVICPKVIKKQAKENAWRFERELNYMILHGILHLLGYEHEKSKSQAEIMFSLQDLVFQRLNKQR